MIFLCFLITNRQLFSLLRWKVTIFALFQCKQFLWQCINVFGIGKSLVLRIVEFSFIHCYIPSTTVETKRQNAKILYGWLIEEVWLTYSWKVILEAQKFFGSTHTEERSSEIQMQFQIYGGDDLNTRALLIKSSSQPLSAAKYCLHQLFSLRWQDFTFTAPPKTWYWEESLLAIAFLAFNFSTFRPMKCFVYIWCTAQFRVSAHLGGTTSYPPLASICPHHWYPKRFQLKNDSRSCPRGLDIATVRVWRKTI